MGRVKVDGEVIVEPGTKVQAGHSRIEVDNVLLVIQQKVYLALNKPRGVLSSTKSQSEKPCVNDLLPKKWMHLVYPVGRLDVSTTGLILMTNDGDFSNHITHPRYDVKKVYMAKVKDHPGNDVLEKIRKGG